MKLLLLAALAIISAHLATSDLAQEPTLGNCFQDGYGFTKGSMGIDVKLTSTSACMLHCQRNSKCVSWAWVKSGADLHTCSLILLPIAKDAAYITKDPGQIIGPKYCPVPKVVAPTTAPD